MMPSTFYKAKVIFLFKLLAIELSLFSGENKSKKIGLGVYTKCKKQHW